MRTLTKKYLGGNELSESSYKIDVIVLEKYQAFSTEILRLSLLGIAGYGFLVANIVLKVNGGDLHLLVSGYLSPLFLILGVFSLALSSLSALAHRFYSSDCLTHFVRLLRLSASEVDCREKIEEEEDSLENDIDRCKSYLLTACCGLVAGAIFVALSFSLVLFNA